MIVITATNIENEILQNIDSIENNYAEIYIIGRYRIENSNNINKTILRELNNRYSNFDIIRYQTPFTHIHQIL